MKLGNNFEKRICLFHIEMKSLKKEKTPTYIYSFLYLVLGLILVISQRNLFNDFDLTLSWYKGSVEYLFLIVTGFTLISMAYNKFIKYLKKANKLKKEEKEINTFLEKNQIKYQCNVEFDKKQFGNYYAIAELKSDSSLIKNSKITFQILIFF